MATIPKTTAQKKLASLAVPKDKITFADKIAGATAPKAKKGAKASKCMKCGGRMKSKKK